VALELLCGVLRINCDFALARVIAIAAKRTINPLVSPGTSDFQMNATFCRRIFERVSRWNKSTSTKLREAMMQVGKQLANKRRGWYSTRQPMAKDFQGNIELNSRVKEILRLLDRSPLPAHLIREASVTFGTEEHPGGSFMSDRRVRQKMQQLVEADLVSEHDFTIAGRGVMKFYQIAPAGYRVLYQDEPPEQHRKFFRPIAKLNWEHTYANAKTIVKTVAAAHRAGVRITSFCRENELQLETPEHTLEPDHFFQFRCGGRFFNVFYEVDLNTETLVSANPKSWRQRILAYDVYQDHLLRIWKHGRTKEPEPRFRVIFLTTTQDHEYRFLTLVHELLANRRRLLFYAATIDEYLNDDDPLRRPILLDHRGHWQAIIQIHPTSSFTRTSVKLPRITVAPSIAV
jgi:hypothetical protein